MLMKPCAVVCVLMFIYGQPICSMGQGLGIRYVRMHTYQTVRDKHMLGVIEDLLRRGATKKEIDVVVGAGRRPVQLAVALHRADLIEPLVRCGFVPNWDYVKLGGVPPLKMALDQLWQGVPAGVRPEIYDDVGQGVSVEELIPVMYTKYHKRIACVARPTDLDVVRELVRCGAMSYVETLPQRLLVSVVPAVYKGGLLRIPAPEWLTKTWRKQVLVFLMASHPRCGVDSPAQALCTCACPNFFQEIAHLVPVHMSMQDRLARRERKKRAREENAREPEAKKRKICQS